MKPAIFQQISLVLVGIFILSGVAISCKSADNHSCMHDNLSDDFSFQVTAGRFLLEDGVEDSLDVNVLVINKHTKQQKNIHFGSQWFFEGSFIDCNRVRSYVTGINNNNDIVDNDYGDIVVADLNFDGKDDFVLKKNAGGTSGADYVFYLQDERGSFTEDRFLTDSVTYFPDEINRAKKQLKTVATAGALCVSERSYQYNPDTRKWSTLSHLFWNEYKYTELSNVYDFNISITEIPQPHEQDSVYVQLVIMDKKGIIKQEIKLSSSFYVKPFTVKDDAQSFSTGFNNDAEAVDKNYGNLVIADFNFDGLEDVALKYEQGGNGGPKYHYYIQHADAVFKENELLSTLGYFPEKFSKNTKELLFRIRLTANEYEEVTCRYTSSSGGWKITKREIIKP